MPQMFNQTYKGGLYDVENPLDRAKSYGDSAMTGMAAAAQNERIGIEGDKNRAHELAIFNAQNKKTMGGGIMNALGGGLAGFSVGGPPGAVIGGGLGFLSYFMS